MGWDDGDVRAAYELVGGQHFYGERVLGHSFAAIMEQVYHSMSGDGDWSGC